MNLPNIVPINVFYIDQFNASQDAKTQFDTDFCNLIREGNEVEDCIKESAESWGERSYGGGVYNTYLHNFVVALCNIIALNNHLGFVHKKFF